MAHPDERRTIDVRTFAQWLGISDSHAYAEARERGHIAGVPVIKIGHRLVLNRELAERAIVASPANEPLDLAV